MEQKFTLDTKTGDIVTQFTKASHIFKKYKINFCCSSKVPIGEALEKRSLDKNAVIQEINQLYLQEESNRNNRVDWSEKTKMELIEHITNSHHQFLNEVLPELSSYISKVHRVHGGNYPELTLVYTLFHHLKNELEHHIYLEEKYLYPKMIKHEDHLTNAEQSKEINHLINELKGEHEGFVDMMAKIRKTTNNYKLPDHACNTFTLTFLKLEEFETICINTFI